MARPVFEQKISNEYVAIGEYFVSKDIMEWAAETILSPEVTKYTGIDPKEWWGGIDGAYQVLVPESEALIKEGPRQKFLTVNNEFHKHRRLQGLGPDPAEHARILRLNGLVPEDLNPFQTAGTSIRQDSIDPRASIDTGPELVGPTTKLNMVSRALHAWQDPREHLYVSNIPDKLNPGVEGLERHARDKPSNQKRLDAIDAIINVQLNNNAALAGADWDKVRDWDAVWNEQEKKHEVDFILEDGIVVGLENAGQFLGFTGRPENPDVLYVRIGDTATQLTFIDGKVKATSMQAIKTWLADIEDATSIVTSRVNKEIGARDLIAAYDNLFHIHRGTLQEKIFREAAKETGERAIPLDPSVLKGISITGVDGNPLKLPGAPLISIRRAGIHVRDASVIDKDGNPMPRGILDTMIIGALAKINTIPELNNGFQISQDGKTRIYIPKLHGAAEVEHAGVKTFRFAEDVNKLDPGTLSPSLMVEEALTNVTVGASVMPIKDTTDKANVGFLDLTASWIRANMEAGLFKPMNALKASAFSKAYNSNAVDACLRAGFNGHGIIGGGMFELIRNMMLMVEQKGAMYSVTGFDNSWYPTPTAAAVGALFNFADHDPHARQFQFLAEQSDTAPEEFLVKILTMPLAGPEDLTPEALYKEILDYMQDMIGYTDRWVKQGIGCSGIVDVYGDERMKDFATLRFASLLTGNRLYHRAVSPEMVLDVMKEATTKVQGFESWGENGDLMDDPTFKAVTELVFNWDRQDYGYVEEVLAKYREEALGNVVPFPARSPEEIYASVPLAELRLAA